MLVQNFPFLLKLGFVILPFLQWVRNVYLWNSDSLEQFLNELIAEAWRGLLRLSEGCPKAVQVGIRVASPRQGIQSGQQGEIQCALREENYI